MIMGILFLSGLGTSAITKDSNNRITSAKTNIRSISFLSLLIEEVDSDYVKICIKDISSYLMNPGHPVIPKVVENFELPFGVRNVDIDVKPIDVKEYIVDNEVYPAPTHIPLLGGSQNIGVKSIKNMEVYGSSEPYPSSWYNYRVGCGLNGENEHVTHVSVHVFPVRYSPATGRLYKAERIDITIFYDEPVSNPFSLTTTYDLAIIAPSEFSNELERLVDHKNSIGVETNLKITEEIYSEYSGIDKPEQIKYFIKDAIENWNIKYVLLIGGLKSLIYANPRDDKNQGSKDWYVPVRYSNLYDKYGNSSIYDPGFLCDLYFADIYKTGGVFDDWDSNDDNVIAARNCGIVQDDEIDLYPDIYLGRLPCRNLYEVKSCVDKIINYESTKADPQWFNRIVAIAGDGLQDQKDLDIQWDVNNLTDGSYTIYAQSRSNITGEWGPIDEVTVIIDYQAESSVNFSEDDHLRIDSYPGPAIAEITSPSNNDILGKTDVDYTPRKAYMGIYWANVTYINKIMHIRGKSYDPRPYGFYTDIKIWIKNDKGETIFTQQKNETKVFFDCEWVTGNRPLGGGRAGALYYMPDEFEKIYLWASNGNFTDQSDVIQTLSKGCGFAFFFGHANPNVMVVNLPGMPGGKTISAVVGLQQINYGLPIFPMNKISNTDKLPIVAVMGCHNSQFNVSLLDCLFGWNRKWVGLYLTLECWSWWLTKIPRHGAIATIGCTGLGPGDFNDEFVPDTGCWIFPEFFRQYGEEDHQILGDAHGQSITNYINTFGQSNLWDVKMVQEFELFGDPSLKIGGHI